ncbi:MAG: HupE/UreJ family protein [Phycisphaeraceae bacterium]
MDRKCILRVMGALALVLAVPQMVWGHAGHAGVEHGTALFAGLLHPLSGLDHLLAMVAVGLWASQLGRRAMIALPAAFVSFMVVGGLLAYAAVPVPLVEQGVVASVLVLGLILATGLRLPVGLGVAMVGAFAVFHGYAHVSELAGHSLAGYGAGFIITTAALHLAGIGLGVLLRSPRRTLVVRAAGGGIAAAALLLSLGAI